MIEMSLRAVVTEQPRLVREDGTKLTPPWRWFALGMGDYDGREGT